MNRSIALVGATIIVVGFALMAFPIVVLGVERLDLEQLAGFLLAPIGLVVVLIGGISHDPRRTTVAGTFGNRDEQPRRPVAPPASELHRAALRYNPKEPVACRHCRTPIPFDVARCPRCSRARECRICGRPLGWVLERATCPLCARSEALCNCPSLPRTAGLTSTAVSRTVRR